MDSTALAELSSLIQKAAVDATRTAAQLQSRSDLDFDRSLSRSFAQNLNEASRRSLELLRCLLELSRPLVSAANGDELEDENDVVQRYEHAVTEVVDGLLEHADAALDRSAGKAAAEGYKPRTSNDIVMRHERGLAKPQLRFRRPAENGREAGIWTPLLRSKVNAAVPLDLDAVEIALPSGLSSVKAIPHPYAAENAALSDSRVLPARPDVTHDVVPLDDAPVTLVKDVEGLRQMLDHLRAVTEIAIDLEHHSLRSYYGITCLMQVSSRSRDFLVDVLDPDVREAAQELNEVFTDSSVVKVFHGAESDIIWLQRDLGLYIVNLFDTYHACRVLRYPKASLAYLLERFCSFSTDKRYQIADWRVRPLPADMMRYARADTHFLLHIYDQLRTDLSHASDVAPDHPYPLGEVLRRSSTTATRTFYRVPFELDDGWTRLLEKWQKIDEWTPATRNYAVFRAVYEWRDRIARELDESALYILSNATLLALAQQVPRTHGEVAKAVPLSSVAATRAAELSTVILDALDTPITTNEEVIKRAGPRSNSVGKEAPTTTAGHARRSLRNPAAIFEQAQTQGLVASTSTFFAADQPRDAEVVSAQVPAFAKVLARPTLPSTARVASILASLSMGGLLQLAPDAAPIEDQVATSHADNGEPSTVDVNTEDSADPEIFFASGRRYDPETAFEPKPKPKSKRPRMEMEIVPHDFSKEPSIFSMPPSGGDVQRDRNTKNFKRREPRPPQGPRLPKPKNQGNMSRTF